MPENPSYTIEENGQSRINFDYYDSKERIGKSIEDVFGNGKTWNYPTIHIDPDEKSSIPDDEIPWWVN